MVELAGFYTIAGLRDMALTNIQVMARGIEPFPVHEFITALRFVYETLNHEEDIKKHMIAWAISDSELLLNDTAFVEVLSDLPRIGVDLALKLMSGTNGVPGSERMECLRCCDCGGKFAIHYRGFYPRVLCPYCGDCQLELAGFDRQ